MSPPIPRLAFCAISLFLAGCVSAPPRVVLRPVPSPPVQPTYEAVPGRGPDVVALLRAAPAPAEPEIGAGRSVEADSNALAAQGYMHIGSAHFPAGDNALRAEAIVQGRAVGADRALVYPPGTDAANPGVLVAYFVRFRLPFGATFRDLTEDEKATLGADGGVEIGSVIGGTPASEADLLPGDYVVRFDGRRVRDKGEFQDLLKANAGRRITLTLVRNGVTVRRLVRLGRLPEANH